MSGQHVRGSALCAAVLLLLPGLAWGAADRPCHVDDRGVLRWVDDGSEVAVFGVNTCLPCTTEFAGLGALGMDRRKVIEEDVLHWQRLGLTSYRVPVWDREISDHDGNLLPNEHLALLDHLVAEAKRRGLYGVLTPMVAYATCNESPGFATIFPMEQLTSDPGKPREAQCRLLAQFVQHRNPETGLTYAEDPAVLVFELINEPLYPKALKPERVTEYINALAGAVRATGCTKPLFYNCWEGMAGAAAASTVEGVTFSWYPTGLVSGAMQTANYLSLVDDYPAMRDEVLATKAKGVYEFDAADVPWGCMYPAMARSFRAGGAQFANQFQYDSWPLAVSNCFCQTHYLSLPYTPGKALSLMIAGEAFRRLPRLARYGRLPQADRFGPFRVSYAEHLSEMVTETEFLYSNGTASRPPSPERLQRIAGVGSSPVVSYDGTGAYFLDRLAPGAWRLEVYPDVVWTADPFARRTERDETARMIWAERRMTVRLPDLSDSFTCEQIAPRHGPRAAGGTMMVTPGVYLLVHKGVEAPSGESAEFFAPPPAVGRPPVVWHEPPGQVLAGSPVVVEASCTEDGARMTLCYRDGQTWRKVPMRRVRAYSYNAEVPAGAVRESHLRYEIALQTASKVTTFPSARSGWPEDHPARAPYVLWAPGPSQECPRATVWNGPAERAATALTAEALALRATDLDPSVDCGADVRVAVRPALVRDETAVIRVRARSLEPATSGVQVTLIQDDEKTYATNLPLSADFSDTDVPVAKWSPCWSTKEGRLDATRVKEVSVALGRWMLGKLVGKPQGVELARISVVGAPDAWDVPVQAVGPPVTLLTPASVLTPQPWQQGMRLSVIDGPGGQPALEIAHPGYGPPPDCTVVSWTLPAATPERRAALAQCDVLRLVLRARTPAVTRLQIGLTEDDGAPWGVDVDVPGEWGIVEVPLDRLAFFAHWARPEGRGGGGDRFHPERLSKCTLAIGAWLSPEHAGEPHVLQVARMELAQSRR